MSAPRVGDRVRVVLEGDVTSLGGTYLGGFLSPSFHIGDYRIGNSINDAAEHVVSVEILPRPLKVGDTIGDDFPAPVGTVVKSADERHTFTRQRNGRWHCAQCDHGDSGFSGRTVVYVPEATR